MLQTGRLNITLDGQFGSTGKGLLNAYIAIRAARKPDICISNAAPNAGHTYVDPRSGDKRTTFHLPVSGVLCPDSLIYLCAGSIIDPELLARELAEFDIDPARIIIHPRAAIVLPEHCKREQDSASGTTALASTRKGVGAALADKIARTHGMRTAAQYYAHHAHHFSIRVLDLDQDLSRGATALMEVPQGFGLSINHGLSYPHCTSRDLTVAAALNDAGVHPVRLGHVTVALRSFPIRVGNITDDQGREIGHSGPFYHDSTEIGWDDLGVVPERTTVTKRIRRIATFSQHQYADMLRQLRPDTILLNFCNYLRSEQEAQALLDAMAATENACGITPARLYGLGPACNDVHELDDTAKLWPLITAQASPARLHDRNKAGQ